MSKRVIINLESKSSTKDIYIFYLEQYMYF